jgi:hypothetical protein
MELEKENRPPNVLHSTALGKRAFGTPVKSPIKGACPKSTVIVRRDSETKTTVQSVDSADNEQLQLASSLAWIMVRKTIWVTDLIPSCVARTSTVQFLGAMVVKYAEKGARMLQEMDAKMQAFFIDLARRFLHKYGGLQQVWQKRSALSDPTTL